MSTLPSSSSVLPGIPDINESPFLQIICGTRKSGKTSLLLKLLCDSRAYKGKFDRIICVCPSIRLDIKWRCIDFEGWEVYESFYDSVVRKTIDEQIKSGAEKRVLMIFDDCGSQKQRIGDSLDDICTVGRHLNISIIFLCQRLAQTNTTMRSQFSSIIVFPGSATKREMEMLGEDVALEPAVIKEAVSKMKTDKGIAAYSFINLVKADQGFIDLFINFEQYEYYYSYH